MDSLKVLRDIRLFTSQVPNKDGEPLPTAIGNKRLNVQVHRIVMKLRESGFSYGDFDHLYLNFTTCPVEGGMPLPAGQRTNLIPGTGTTM